MVEIRGVCACLWWLCGCVFVSVLEECTSFFQLQQVLCDHRTFDRIHNIFMSASEGVDEQTVTDNWPSVLLMMLIFTYYSLHIVLHRALLIHFGRY